RCASGSDLTFATLVPRVLHANVKSKAPLASIKLASGPLTPTFANVAPRWGANVGVGPLAAAGVRKLINAGQRGPGDFAVDAPRLLGVAEPERQADIRRWLEFDARTRAIAGQRAGRGVEGGERASEAGIVFQRVEAGIDCDGQPARFLEVVAELHAFIGERV